LRLIIIAAQVGAVKKYVAAGSTIRMAARPTKAMREHIIKL
jgi:hypothetical protein